MELLVLVRNSFICLMVFLSTGVQAQIDYSKLKTNKSFEYNDYFDKNIINPLEIKVDNKTCWDKAGETYNIDPWLIYAVAIVESSLNPLAINKNKNDSIDVGIMQINSFWFKELEKFGIKPVHLLDPCTSIMVGAWVMAQNLQRYGYSVNGIGAYNSSKKEIRLKYTKKVYDTYIKLVNNYHRNYNGK